MDMRLRAKKLACKIAAVLCEEDLDAGLLETRYAGLKEQGGPSVGMIEAGMRELIEELVKRSKPS